MQHSNIDVLVDSISCVISGFHESVAGITVYGYDSSSAVFGGLVPVLVCGWVTPPLMGGLTRCSVVVGRTMVPWLLAFLQVVWH